MIIKCPECGSLYNIPNIAIGDTGRFVRCGFCEYEWVANSSDDITSVQNTQDNHGKTTETTNSENVQDHSESIQPRLTGFIPQQIRYKQQNTIWNTTPQKIFILCTIIIFMFYAIYFVLHHTSIKEKLLHYIESASLNANGVKIESLEIFKSNDSELKINTMIVNSSDTKKIIRYIRLVCYDSNMQEVYEHITTLDIQLIPGSNEFVEYTIITPKTMQHNVKYISIDLGSHIEQNLDSMSFAYKHFTV